MAEDIKIGFGQRVKDYRLVHKWSQEFLAEKLDTTSQAISNIERGKTFPLPKRIADFANLFNISPIELFNIDYKRRKQEVEKNILAINELLTNHMSDNQIALLYSFLKEIVN